jgi:hypothetical protein
LGLGQLLLGCFQLGFGLLPGLQGCGQLILNFTQTGLGCRLLAAKSIQI